jgi:hypothetical protein
MGGPKDTLRKQNLDELLPSGKLYKIAMGKSSLIGKYGIYVAISHIMSVSLPRAPLCRHEDHIRNRAEPCPQRTGH